MIPVERSDLIKSRRRVTRAWRGNGVIDPSTMSAESLDFFFLPGRMIDAEPACGCMYYYPFYIKVVYNYNSSNMEPIYESKRIQKKRDGRRGRKGPCIGISRVTFKVRSGRFIDRLVRSKAIDDVQPKMQISQGIIFHLINQNSKNVDKGGILTGLNWRSFTPAASSRAALLSQQCK